MLDEPQPGANDAKPKSEKGFYQEVVEKDFKSDALKVAADAYKAAGSPKVKDGFYQNLVNQDFKSDALKEKETGTPPPDRRVQPIAGAKGTAVPTPSTNNPTQK